MQKEAEASGDPFPSILVFMQNGSSGHPSRSIRHSKRKPDADHSPSPQGAEVMNVEII
jgi:hypothetical protein